MDWAEELKLSIRKTTARKGRRSSQQKPQSGSPTTPEKEISLDLSIDINQDTTTDSSDSKLPPRRISGGWADSGLKSSKHRNKNLLDDERFRQSSKSNDSSPPEEDIPIIPDLDDVKEDIIMNEIVEPPSVTVNRVVTLKELNSDLLSQNAFSAIEDVDLTILTRCLQAQDSLDEADEVWEWDKLFTDVTAEIHSDKTTIEGKIEIAADEITHTFT
ncbi:intraflagellar transport protein 43 homolog [Episyrphus balteatus]|uniref:intraflagellar transport protein 43 homolog n=1 Tax=Episyrphus balteatus TaxID=286459 RepID=UPI002485D3EE|nr:intraflagellar transport protein 43 homolog [Episyrphus balteatus]